MTRVAGVDPGTVSFDLCVLEDGEPVIERVFETGELSADPAPLLAALHAHAPYDLVYGPSGYGLPLLEAGAIGDPELALMVLVRPDEARAATGIGGLRGLLRAIRDSGLPVVFGPGVIHLSSVPAHRKRNRVDLGTADKLCSAACALSDHAARHGRAAAEASFLHLELGGAFTAALAVDRGRIVDGVGGTGGPPGARAAGALDGELAYLLGRALTKSTLFSGGAFGAGDATAGGRTVLLEGALKSLRALTVSVPAPAEIVVGGRHAADPELIAALAGGLADLAPVHALVPGAASSAARGGALLADGLCGGRHAPLVEALALRDCGGTALDHLHVDGAESIRLG